MVPATITGTHERSHYTSDVPRDQGMTSWYRRRSQGRPHGTTVPVTIIGIHERSDGTSDVPRDTWIRMDGRLHGTSEDLGTHDRPHGISDVPSDPGTTSSY